MLCLLLMGVGGREMVFGQACPTPSYTQDIFLASTTGGSYISVVDANVGINTASNIDVNQYKMIQYFGLPGFDPTVSQGGVIEQSNGIMEGGRNRYSIRTLLPGTNYQTIVKIECLDGTLVGYSARKNFVLSLETSQVEPCDFEFISTLHGDLQGTAYALILRDPSYRNFTIFHHQMEFVLPGYAPGTGRYTVRTSKQQFTPSGRVTAIGLADGITYNVFLQVVCPSGEVSEWKSLGSVTPIGDPCNVSMETELTISAWPSDPTQQQAVVTLNTAQYPNANNYVAHVAVGTPGFNVYSYPSGFITWNSSQISNGRASMTLNDLVDGETYEAIVYFECADGAESVWQERQTFVYNAGQTQTCDFIYATSTHYQDGEFRGLDVSVSQNTQNTRFNFFDVEIGVAGFIPGSGSALHNVYDCFRNGVQRLPIPGGLVAGSYDVYFRTTCESGAIGPWRRIHQFTKSSGQLCLPNVTYTYEVFRLTDPVAGTVAIFDINGATIPNYSQYSLGWGVGPIGFVDNYSTESTQFFSRGTTSIADNKARVLLSNAPPGVHEMYLYFICEDGTQQPIGPRFPFTIPQNPVEEICVLPTQVQIRSITHTTFEYDIVPNSASPANGAAEFRVEILPAGGIPGVGNALTTYREYVDGNFQLIYNLTPGTTYDLYVRTTCNYGSFTNYELKGQITTLAPTTPSYVETLYATTTTTPERFYLSWKHEFTMANSLLVRGYTFQTELGRAGFTPGTYTAVKQLTGVIGNRFIVLGYKSLPSNTLYDHYTRLVHPDGRTGTWRYNGQLSTLPNTTTRVAHNSDPAAHSQVELTAELPTEAPILKLKAPRVYPNPASDFVTFERPNAQFPATLHLTDVAGRTLQIYQLASGQTSQRVDLSGLLKATYLLTLHSADGNSLPLSVVVQ